MSPPAGFAAWHRRVEKDPSTPEVLSDWLGLVGYEASPEAISRWSLDKRVEAEVYAVSVHLRASDNAVRRHPRPDWMPEPWRGPASIGAGIFESPAGTRLE